MTMYELQVKFTEVLNRTSITELLGGSNIYFYFPPKEQIDVFPRVQFYFMNQTEESFGDDESELKEVRLVLDIYGTYPPLAIADAVLQEVKQVEGVSAKLENGFDKMSTDDYIFGKHLEIKIEII